MGDEDEDEDDEDEDDEDSFVELIFKLLKGYEKSLDAIYREWVIKSLGHVISLGFLRVP